MSAAKAFLRPLSYTTIFTTAAFAGAIGINPRQRKPITRLDSPSSSQWPQDAKLLPYAQRAQDRVLEKQPATKHSKKGDAEIINDATDADTYSATFEDEDENAWGQFSRNFGTVLDGVWRIEWGGLGDRIAEFMLPSWAKLIPAGIQKLQFELSMEEGSLADEIWQEAHDAEINPEIFWQAKVRVGDGLGPDELKFREKRKAYITKSFTKYLGLDEEVHPEDIPTIAMCGSGGGLRALVAGSSSYLCAQEAGLFDCVTYTAGVSGSCWLQTLFYSSLGKQDHTVLLRHIKSRISTHIAFPPPALKLITSAPTNKFILSGFIEKLKGDPGATFGLVDIYSLLLAARLMVPHGELDVHDYDLKLSNQRTYLKNGEHPMPIYTLVRHEIPYEEESKKSKPTNNAQEAQIRNKALNEAWFQWIELHPWEVWCEEFGAGIPTWSLGRPFENGTNKILDTGVGLPEIRQSLLLGIYGSAFCATLAHYYKEIRPVLSGIAIFKGLDGLLEDKDDDLVKIHPIEPATIPNFVYGMKGKLPATCPESVFSSDHLQVMDAGMSNNLPIYPLLRPGRDVDVLIAFDASADIQDENWLSVVDGYAKQRGIQSWPVGTGWPKASVKPQENVRALEEAKASSPQEAARKLAEAREKRRRESASGSEPDSGSRSTSDSSSGSGLRSDAQSAPPAVKPKASDTDLTHCNIWVSSNQERSSGEEPPASKRLDWNNAEDTTFHLMKPDASMTIVYFPLLPNDKVPGVHPDKTDFLSTWNFIYAPDEIDKVVELARRNFEAGADATKRTIRTVYERKKAARLAKEEEGQINWWRRKLRESGDAFAGNS